MRPAFDDKNWDVATDSDINSALLQRASAPAPSLELTLLERDKDEEDDVVESIAPGHAFVQAVLYTGMLLTCVAYWYGIVKLVFSL